MSAFPQRGEKCNADETKAEACSVDAYNFADKGDVEMMKAAVSHQPIAAAMNAKPYEVMLYKSGVLDDQNLDATELNHAVVVVGYGTEQGGDYWLIKNSYGSTWGEDGYMRIAIAPDAGILGIQSNAVWTVLK